MNRAGEPDVAVLLAQLAANAAEIAALKAEKEAFSRRVVKLEKELALAKLDRFAPRSEKHIDRLFNEAEIAADEDGSDDGDAANDLPDTGLPAVDRTAGKKRGRRPLPEDLPRERVESDLPEDQKACPCCHGQMHRMGEAVTEQLHIEVKAKVLQNVRFEYACRHCDRTGINTPVVIAPMPTQPLPGSVATASTLAFALVHKYVDGTPLYRVARTFERAGVPISRGALAHWVIGSSEKHLHRIYEALKLRLRSHPLIHGDETTVQVLKEKNKEATSTSYMWAYRSGKHSDEPIVLLDYQPGRGQIHPQTFLGDYRGILVSDGYTAWRTINGSTHVSLPMMVLPTYSVLLTIPKNLMPAAASLGARPLRAFVRVLLPLSFGGIAAGSLLVFMSAIGYYITPALIGGAGDQMISSFIAFHAQNSGKWGMASALGIVLLVVTIILYVVYDRLATQRERSA
ncbi:IS66 family transposase [Agrobacterium rubi]|uniref:IS66 family transposase n=1 Tax=Agrobacterium rubi TaxID=28099 RepID=A0AAE7R556_9HYPH|nr:IS66 family transposase [Agrobacterium rubi]NTE87898.1 IS66 family transposase [Agrobacterium rubi]NTF03665.1 IS66 family transposase [Agrobacterium rubi]NTF37991.1 IS66 family transposase [Agrobacterium rubi]QTG02085.1 IS66 family transposase [Agrobacterium rubi]